VLALWVMMRRELGMGVLYEPGAVDAVLEEGGGDCIYVASF
jgi:hypothetical protein